MCGRFALSIASFEQLEKFLFVLLGQEAHPGCVFPWPDGCTPDPAAVTGRDAIPPRSTILAVLAVPSAGVPVAGFPVWGMRRNLAGRSRTLINLRSEKLAAHEAGAGFMRCLIPADGFYEWSPCGEAWLFRREDSALFAMAGLWSPLDGTCAVLTSEADGTVAPVHHRMPFIPAAGGYVAWLAGRPDLPVGCPEPLVGARLSTARTAVDGPDPQGLLFPD
ncbi:MAG TPA: SOS response-associated peptidase family protein [Spirochaetota bacterium]|nr:SOS response-associated peptidase family protein [Spirochaetota bacterium]